MRNLTKKTTITLVGISILLIEMTACSYKSLEHFNKPAEKKSVSEYYHHFENGLIFSDIESGLNVLWEASFKNGKLYKENIGFFVPQGLLILPNKDNTANSSRFSSLYVFTRHKKLWVEHQGSYIEVLGIVHTHPNDWGMNIPTSRSDYQFGYLGIHNYILTHNDLIDAYLDSKGDETYDRLGKRDSFTKIPFIENYKMLLAQL